VLRTDTRPRTVLVTGAADGIGRAIAAHFAAAGDHVALCDIAADRLEASARALTAAGGRVTPVVMDVSSEQSVEAGFARAAAISGRIDVVVSNVGVAGGTPVVDMSIGEWRRVTEPNLTGTFLVTRAAARQMIRQGGGKICCMTSLAARSARMGAAHYCASKAGLEQLTRVLAMELGPHHVNVNLVSPGFVNHGFREGIGEWVTPEYAAAIERSIPWGRTATVDDVIGAVDFLCSDRADYITGALLTVDGGGGAGRYSLPITDATDAAASVTEEEKAHA
jgi:3-oxoacyl-[acyl-carrier protein] reductase